MRSLSFTAAAILVLGSASSATAQVPFFTPGATAFSPQVSILNTGALNDVQATVTPDRRYVTLDMRPANSQLLALREFTFQIPGTVQVVAGVGFVGGVAFDPPTGELGALNAPVVLK